MSRVRANQNAESPVSTRPLSGISVGSTTSKVEMRSDATSRSRLSSSAYSSRTLPLPTCTASVMSVLPAGRIPYASMRVKVTQDERGHVGLARGRGGEAPATRPRHWRPAKLAVGQLDEPNAQLALRHQHAD